MIKEFAVVLAVVLVIATVVISTVFLVNISIEECSDAFEKDYGVVDGFKNMFRRRE